jgi:hypothetical protein
MKAALALGAMAAMAAGQAFMQAEQQRAHKQAQAGAAENNAIAMRQQADVERQKGEAETRRHDMDRDKLSRDYQARAGAQRSLLASGNVDIASGSAADSLLGNAALYGEDLAANRHKRALASWQADENARQARRQADAYAAQASWLNASAGNIGDSLLSAGMAGAGSYLQRRSP